MILKSDLVSSRQNEAVKRLLSLDDKKGRDTESVFVLDGIKLFEEAVKSGAAIDTVYISSEKVEQYLPFITSALQGELYATTRVIRLETSLFERISREKSPQGVITLVKYLDKIQNIIKINKVTTFLNDGVSGQGILVLSFGAPLLSERTKSFWTPIASISIIRGFCARQWGAYSVFGSCTRSISPPV